MQAPEILAPHDAELERTLLQSVIADNGRMDRLAGLTPDDLYDPVHAQILAACLDLREERCPVNLVTLKGRFGNVPFGDDGTVFGYISDLQFAGTEAGIDDLVVALKDLSRRRDMQAFGERIAGAVHDRAASPASLLTDAARDLDELLAKCRPTGKTLRTMPQAIDKMLAAIRDGDKDARIPTGFADLDRLTGGFRRGETTILGGRPSMGKSAQGVAFGARAAKAGHGVLVFSLEMTSDHWMARMSADAAWTREDAVPFAMALRGELAGRDLQRFVDGADRCRGLPLVIDEQSGLTASDIASRTRKVSEMFAREGKQLGLVIIDYLGKIRPSSRYRGQKVNEIAEVSDALTHLAKSENVAVLALHQLSRQVEGRDNKRPTLSDLRDSGALEQDADVVLFVYRPAYYLERMREDDADRERLRQAELEAKRNVLEVHVAKNRNNGATGVVELYADMAANAFRDKWRGAA